MTKNYDGLELVFIHLGVWMLFQLVIDIWIQSIPFILDLIIIMIRILIWIIFHRKNHHHHFETWNTLSLDQFPSSDQTSNVLTINYHQYDHHDANSECKWISHDRHLLPINSNHQSLNLIKWKNFDQFSDWLVQLIS